MFDNFLIHTFHDGNCLQAYKIFGAHFETHEGKKGVRFTTYAPNARSAQVVGEFNQWGETPCYMQKYNNGGIYTIFVEGVKEFDMYKFRFETPQGDIIDKADPYAYFSELRPGTASKVYNMEGYRWHDSKWVKNRTKNYDRPLNIYEASLGSWKMKRESEGEGDDGEYYSYEELIDEIIPYVKKMGYTHLEVMPLTEFPFDGSWGYQATGFYSATSRYGQPKQLMKFIDACHQEGIGVIMDFVPAHFVKDSHGLHMYDGGFVYDYNDYNRRYSPWDSVYFGRYWQIDTNNDGKADDKDNKTPIQWRVLSVDNDEVLLLADKCLEYRQFHNRTEESVTWENCSLRKWLNNEFYNNAFSADEKNAIVQKTLSNDIDSRYVVECNDTQDNVALLSWDEAFKKDYALTNSKINLETHLTDFVKQKGGTKIGLFTRTSSKQGVVRISNVADNLYEGRYGSTRFSNYISVRPIITIKKASSLWKNAGVIHNFEWDYEESNPVETPSAGNLSIDVPECASSKVAHSGKDGNIVW